MTKIPDGPPGDNQPGFWERLTPSTARFLRAQGVELGAAPSPATAPERPAKIEKASLAPPAPPLTAPRQWHRQGRKLTRAQRVSSRRRALERRERDYLERLTRRCKAKGYHFGIRVIPMRVWAACAQVIADPTGRAARMHLKRLNNRTAAGAILDAAIPERSGRTWAALRVRRIAALGIALVMLAHRTRRRGPWGALVRGIPRAALAALLRDPFDDRAPGADGRAPAIPSVTALFGTHRPGAAPMGPDVGYFVPLRAAGVAYAQQLPAEQVQSSEVGPSGHALNRYWVASDTPETIDDDTARARAFELAELAQADARRLDAQVMRERRATADKPEPPD